jgi:polysaccharide pyruvyl transferase WcaK-like protein
LPKISIIHVGDLNNKGAYALLKTEISELRRIYGNPELSFCVSNANFMDSVKRETGSEAFPPLVDIPYERADAKAVLQKKSRHSMAYKLYLIAYTFLSFSQILFALFSMILVRMGLKPIYRQRTHAELAKSDLVVSTADENFKEGASGLPFNILLRVVSLQILLSRLIDTITAKRVYKKPIILFPNSIGPFFRRSAYGRKL